MLADLFVPTNKILLPFEHISSTLDAAALKKMMNDQSLTSEERYEARIKFQKLPRNASPSRVVRRCQVTGRPHAVYRKFGLSRIKLREAAMRGDIPGLVKSSW